MNFAAIDFETANEKRYSVCSMGVVLVESGEIVKSSNWLIKPPELRFNRKNICIHGIKEEDVIDKLEFFELWPEIKTYLDEKIVLAHNAAFDLYALRDIIDYYNLNYPDIKYCCTIQIAQKTWGHLPNYRLKTIVKHLNINTERHQALADARTCAEIALRSALDVKANTLDKLIKSLGLHIKSFPQKDYWS